VEEDKILDEIEQIKRENVMLKEELEVVAPKGIIVIEKKVIDKEWILTMKFLERKIKNSKKKRTT
jgi:hypothetical protein